MNGEKRQHHGELQAKQPSEFRSPSLTISSLPFPQQQSPLLRSSFLTPPPSSTAAVILIHNGNVIGSRRSLRYFPGNNTRGALTTDVSCMCDCEREGERSSAEDR